MLPSTISNLLWLCVSVTATFSLSDLSENAHQLFTESMAWLDSTYDSEAGYLFDPSGAAALRHDVRSSAYYAVGLLARGSSADVSESMKIIRNIVAGQFKDPSKQWYGTYQKYPEEPTVGTPSYPQKMYDTWDPNWRGFIGNAFIIALEEFGEVIDEGVKVLIEESLFNATVGDSYRVGGVDGDNLYPAYSNPSIMRAFVSGWTGRRLNERNMTDAGETYAKEIIELFDRANTLSEFNSGTYTGVSLWALTMWAKYMPEDSAMKSYGAKMLKHTWESVAEVYHPQLKNLGGPWDRGYGFDMKKYLSIIALHFWCLVGKKDAPLYPQNVPILSHNADYSIGPLIAILSAFHDALVPANVTSALTGFVGEHTYSTSAFSPPWDTYPRNISSWLADRISIGGESLNETVVGGPAKNPSQFNPAVIQWDTGADLGFITLYATEPAIHAVASSGSLNISYPSGNASSTFQLIVSPFKQKVDITSWDDVPGLDLIVSGTVSSNFTISYSGAYGAAINDFKYWNFTYSMPAGSREVPSIVLQVAKT